MAIINFDARTVQPDAGRMGPVPAAWYNFAVTESEVVPGKSDPINAARLNITCKILDGEYKGRTVYHGFNIKNPSAKAMEISFAQLSAIAHAVGVLMVQDSSQLHNIPFKGKVKVTPGDGQYEPKNEFTAFKNVNDATAVNLPGAPAGANPAMAPVRPAAPAMPAPGAAPGGWGQAPAAPAQATPQTQVAPPAQPAPQWQAPAAAQPWSNPAAVETVAAAAAVTGAQPWSNPAAEQAPAQAAVAPAAAQPEAAAPAAVVAAGQTPPPWMTA